MHGLEFKRQLWRVAKFAYPHPAMYEWHKEYLSVYKFGIRRLTEPRWANGPPVPPSLRVVQQLDDTSIVVDSSFLDDSGLSKEDLTS